MKNNKGNKVLASIVIPIYNCGSVLEDTLETCLFQKTKYNYEIIIVNDGSTDDTTLKILNKYSKYKTIKVINKKHSGISDTLNLGIKLSSGAYIIRMDGDDLMYNNRLEYQINYMLKNKNVDVLCSNIDRFLNGKLYDHAPSLELIKNKLDVEDLFNAKLNYNFICHPAVCFRKSLYLEIIKNDVFYDSNYDGMEDYELWVRLIGKYNKNITTDDVKVLLYNVSSVKRDNKNLINKLYYEYTTNLFTKTIGIYYICTGIYKNDFPRFIRSLNKFFPNNKKHVILISDGISEPKKYETNNITIEHHIINDYPWPIVTLFKMKYIETYQCNCDYVFYFNANSEILDSDYSWFDKDKLNLTYHKDWFDHNEDPTVFLEPYMDNPNSVSYFGTKDYTYVQAAFFGGNAELVYNMCKEVNEMINIDLCNNIIPRYHDETYLNKYNYLHNNANISNVLISQIVYDITNTNHIYNLRNNKPKEDTQFIILHENIYKQSENAKKDKFSNFIKPHYLKPLYNYENIYNYIHDYKEENIGNNVYNGKPLIIIYLHYYFYELDKLRNLYKTIDKNIYDVMVVCDQNINNDYLYYIRKMFSSDKLLLVNLTQVMHNLSNKINNWKLDDYFDMHYMLIIYNVLYEFIFGNFPNFTKAYIFTETQFDNDIYKQINDMELNFKDENIDFFTNKLYVFDIDKFINNDFVKKFDLFKFKYRFKEHVFADDNLSFFMISHNALNYVHNVKSELKGILPVYGLPTLLNNANCNIGSYE